MTTAEAAHPKPSPSRQLLPLLPARCLPSRAPSRVVGELQELTYRLFPPKHHNLSWPLQRRFQHLGAPCCLPPRHWQCPATAGSLGCASKSICSITGSNLGIINPRCSRIALWGAHSEQLSSSPMLRENSTEKQSKIEQIMILQGSRAGVAGAEIAGDLQLVHEQKHRGRAFRNNQNSPCGRHSTRSCGCKCLDTALKSGVPLPRPPPRRQPLPRAMCQWRRVALASTACRQDMGELPPPSSWGRCVARASDGEQTWDRGHILGLAGGFSESPWLLLHGSPAA